MNAANPTSPTAAHLAEVIDLSGLTHRELADAAGFRRGNVMSMMKRGEMKVPIDRIPALAEACGVDARRFIAIALHEYHPDIWSVIRRSFDEVLTPPELELLHLFRARDPEGAIEIDGRIGEALGSVFGLLAEHGRERRALPDND